MSTGLTFEALREANQKRLPLFRNGRGEFAHPTPPDGKPLGSDWSPGEWVCAVVGELGELANLIKKVRRGDVTLTDLAPGSEPGGPTVRDEIADELADVACYLDILASQFGVELDEAIVSKFNRISKRVDAPVRFEEYDLEARDFVYERRVRVVGP